MSIEYLTSEDIERLIWTAAMATCVAHGVIKLINKIYKWLN